jgi:hypothetical protein
MKDVQGSMFKSSRSDGRVQDSVQKNSNVKHVFAGESATFKWTFEAVSDTLNIELLNLERAAVYE